MKTFIIVLSLCLIGCGKTTPQVVFDVEEPPQGIPTPQPKPYKQNAVQLKYATSDKMKLAEIFADIHWHLKDKKDVKITVEVEGEVGSTHDHDSSIITDYVNELKEAYTQRGL